MASLSELRAALAAQLETMTSLQGIYTDEPGQVSPPAAVIRLGSPAITYSTSVAGGSHDYSFTILLLVGNASTVGQEALDGYLDTSGPDSIYAAVDDDPTRVGSPTPRRSPPSRTPALSPGRGPTTWAPNCWSRCLPDALAAGASRPRVQRA